MMTMRYARATAPALDEQRAARERRLWQYWAAPAVPTAVQNTTTSGSTSGSDCSADSSPELADLVNSFYNGDDTGAVPSTVVAVKGDREVLFELLSGAADESDDDLGALLVARRIRREADAAFKAAVKAVAGGNGGTWDWDEATKDEVAAIKRKVMWTLRQRGFDAGLCKSRPDKETCRFPAGAAHDYIDVLVPADDDHEGGAGGTRYIVELGLASEFGIARPTEGYAALLDVFPRVFVGKPETLKNVVGIMCAAAAVSLKSQDMYVAPWRRREYVMAKWFGPYKRTTRRVPSPSSSSSSSSISSASSASSSLLTKAKARTKTKEEEPAAGVAGIGGGHWAGGMVGCRAEEWERRRALVCLAGMYM